MIFTSLATGVFLLASGCGSSASGSGGGAGARPGKNAQGGSCVIPKEKAPTFEALGAIEFPKSRVWVHAAIPMDRAVARISKEIPVTLASEKDRDVGAPGKATYKVTRGEPTLHQTEQGLQVRVPVSADISVCKPIGSACIRYGGCQPELEASFSVGTALGKNYELAPPQGTIAATKKCVVGIDVTSQIESVAKKEVAKVQAQIAAEWPQLKPEAKRGWKELANPIAIADDMCVNMAPQKIAYQSPTIEKKGEAQIIRAALGITGELHPAADCNTRSSPGPLPAPTLAQKPNDDSRLWIPELLALDAAKSGLTESLSGKWGTGGTLEVLDVVFEKSRVALQVKSDGDVCGQFWITGSFAHSSGAAALTLDKLTLDGAPDASEQTKALLAHVKKTAQIPLASSEWFTGERLGPLKTALRGIVPEDVNFEIRKLKAKDARVVATKDGIYLLHPLSAQLVITDL